MGMLTDEMYEVKKRADGRWIVVYGKNMPQAGQQWKGTKDYSTRELAIAAVTGKGRKESMFDRFLLDEEPEPVEWGNDSEKGMLGEDGKTMSDNEGDEDGEAQEDEVAPALSDGLSITLIINGKGMLNGG